MPRSRISPFNRALQFFAPFYDIHFDGDKTTDPDEFIPDKKPMPLHTPIHREKQEYPVQRGRDRSLVVIMTTTARLIGTDQRDGFIQGAF